MSPGTSDPINGCGKCKACLAGFASLCAPLRRLEHRPVQEEPGKVPEDLDFLSVPPMRKTYR